MLSIGNLNIQWQFLAPDVTTVSRHRRWVISSGWAGLGGSLVSCERSQEPLRPAGLRSGNCLAFAITDWVVVPSAAKLLGSTPQALSANQSRMLTGLWPMRGRRMVSLSHRPAPPWYWSRGKLRGGDRGPGPDTFSGGTLDTEPRALIRQTRHSAACTLDSGAVKSNPSSGENFRKHIKFSKAQIGLMGDWQHCIWSRAWYWLSMPASVSDVYIRAS